MNRATLTSAGLLLALLVAADPGLGQVPDSVLRRNDCRLAHQVLTLGKPANRREWALHFIDGCGELGGQALASLVLEHRLEDEVGGELEQVVTRTQFLVAQEIFDAASDVAVDAGAGTVARVQAIRILFTQLYPGSLDPYDSFSENTTVVGGTLTEAALRNEPLPKEAFLATESRLRTLLTEGVVPDPVRNAATRLLEKVLFHLYMERHAVPNVRFVGERHLPFPQRPQRFLGSPRDSWMKGQYAVRRLNRGESAIEVRKGPEPLEPNAHSRVVSRFPAAPAPHTFQRYPYLWKRPNDRRSLGRKHLPKTAMVAAGLRSLRDDSR